MALQPMHVLTDIKRAARALVHAPMFTVMVVTTLGLGIGATTAIVSVVDGVLLNPLPYPDSERLVLIWERSRTGGIEREWLSPAQFRDIRDEAASFGELALLIGGPGLLNLDGPPEHSGYIQSTSSFLRMLGAKPLLGRVLSEEDDNPDATPVVVITHSLWERRFGRDPDVVGKTMGIERFDVRIVGVLEPGFLLDNEVFPMRENIGSIETIVSMRLTEQSLARRDRKLYCVLARLRNDVSLDEAQAELDVIAERLAESSGETIDSARRFDIVALLDQVVGSVRARLWMILAGAAFLLVVACTNVSNLLLSRAFSRTREIGVRAAIGASRTRLIAELLSESLLFSLAGGVLGLGLAWAGVTTLRYVAPPNIPRLNEVGVDLRILIFALGLSLLTVVISGWLPAWRASRIDVVGVIKGTLASSRVLPKSLGFTEICMAAQICAAFVLLNAAVLLLQSFNALVHVEPGFEPRGRVTMRIQESPRQARTPEAIRDLFTLMLERIRSLPGVTSAATGTPLPFAPGSYSSPIDIEGYIREPGEPAIVADGCTVSPTYFETMGTTLLAGRVFEPSDYMADAGPVRIVDRLFAERLWPGGTAIGRRIREADDTDDDRFATIVGVVESVQHYALESEPRMTAYEPRLSVYRTYLVISTDGDPQNLANPIVNALRDVEPEIAISDVRTMADRMDDALAPQRLSLLLVQSFAVVALLLTVVGLHTLISQAVSRGTPEIAVRIALGASPARIVRFVTSFGIRIASLGISLGCAAGLAATGLMSHLLFGVRPMDPASYILAALVVGSLSVLVCWLPTRRASQLEPVAALRSE